jgi:YtoQ family protein
MKLTVYLSGEIHTDWREEIVSRCLDRDLDIEFLSPVLDHALSDNCGVKIMGPEADNFWHDSKGAKLNAIRTRTAIQRSDVVVVRFGEKYRQWNAAFDAGYAAALGKAMVIMHSAEHQHALKEVDAAALAVVESSEQVAAILAYTIKSQV